MTINYNPIGLIGGGTENALTEVVERIPLTWELDVGRILILQGYGKIELDAAETNAFLFRTEQIASITKSLRLAV